jgi:hypothetical protein
MFSHNAGEVSENKTHFAWTHFWTHRGTMTCSRDVVSPSRARINEKSTQRSRNVEKTMTNPTVLIGMSHIEGEPVSRLFKFSESSGGRTRG